MTPNWKAEYDQAVRAADKVADEARCGKTELVRVYVGSFVEQDEPFRCLLDLGHLGKCCMTMAELETWEPSDNVLALLADADRYRR